MAKVIQATAQNVEIRASAKEIASFRASGFSAKLIQERTILLTQGQFISAFGRTGRAGQSFDIFSGQFVVEAAPGELEITERGIGAGVRPTGEIIREIPARVPTRAPPLEIVGIGEGVPARRPPPRRVAEEIFEKATPVEKAALVGTTLLGPRGFELLGAIPSLPPPPPAKLPEPIFETIFERQVFEAPKPFEAEIEPSEAVFRRIEDLLKVEPEKVTITRPVPRGLGIEFKEQEILLPAEFVAGREAAVTGPIFEAEAFFLGGAALGIATRIPRVAKIITAPAVQDIGKIVSGVFLGREVSAERELIAAGKIAEARGRALALGTGLFAVGKGFRIGERVGELKIRIPSEAKRLAKEGIIPKRAEEIIRFGARKGFDLPRGEVIVEPERVVIRGARPKTQKQVLAEIKKQEAEIFGSLAQESQLIERRIVQDIDIAVSGSKADVRAAKRVFKRVAGDEIKVDIKGRGRLEEFLFREKRPIITPEGQRLTTLREQALRKLTGAVTRQRIARKGLKEVEDLDRILRQAFAKESARLTKAERRVISGKPFKAPKFKPTGKPLIDESSFLPSKLPKSLIPSVIGVRTLLPRPPSRLPPSRVPRRVPSLLPPKITPRRPSVIPPRRRAPIITPSSVLGPSKPSPVPSRLPSRLPPRRPSILPSRLPPSIIAGPPTKPFIFDPFKKERIKRRPIGGFLFRVVKHKLATPSELIFGRKKRGRKTINVLDLI